MKKRLVNKYEIIILVLVLLFFLYAKFVYSPVIYKIQERYKNFNTTGIPEGLSSLSARECGRCHVEIYKEWRTSMHAKAFVDPYFQAYLKKDRYHWTCYYCHTPLQSQLEFKVIGFAKNVLSRPIYEINEGFNSRLRREGVTCAGCHVVDGIIYGPYKDANAPHPTGYDAKFKTTEICETCHEVPKESSMFYKSNPCGTVEEFNNGPYEKKGYTCQTCHMPQAVRTLTMSSKVFRNTGRHTFMGGHSKEMLEKALYIDMEKDGKNFYLRVLNNGAGHKFPTGDPDRYVKIITRFYDNDENLIREETETLKRTILYYPIIIEFFDTRLSPLTERTYTYKGGDILNKAKSAVVEVEYHILSDRAKKRLVKKYGLPAATRKMYKLKPVKFSF
jgi:hypothetical protein